MVKQNEVHAQHGKWSLERDAAGSLRCYVGRFHPDDHEHARGTARFLASSNICNGGYHEPAKDGNNHYIVRVVCGLDNDRKFMEWAIGHDFMPETFSEEVRRTRHGEDMQALAAHERQRLAFRPVSKDVGERLIDQLNWEETAGPDKNFIYTAMQTPQLAFQAALRLKNQHYLSDKRFWQINDEIKEAKRLGLRMEFRVAVSHEHIERFSKQFPEAGLLKPLIDKGFVNKIIELSSWEHPAQISR